MPAIANAVTITITTAVSPPKKGGGGTAPVWGDRGGDRLSDRVLNAVFAVFLGTYSATVRSAISLKAAQTLECGLDFTTNTPLFTTVSYDNLFVRSAMGRGRVKACC